MGYRPSADVGSHHGSYYGMGRGAAADPMRGGGDILDLEVNSQAGPAGALSGRSSNARGSFDGGNMQYQPAMIGAGNQSPLSRMQQQAPTGPSQRINTTFSQQNQGPSSVISPAADRVMSGTDSQKNKSVLLT